MTYDLLRRLAAVKNLREEEVMEAFGVFFSTTVLRDEGYSRVLACLGTTLPEKLQGLNGLHSNVPTEASAYCPPGFTVTNVTGGSLELHYHSRREGLWPMVKARRRALRSHAPSGAAAPRGGCAARVLGFGLRQPVRPHEACYGGRAWSWRLRTSTATRRTSA